MLLEQGNKSYVDEQTGNDVAWSGAYAYYSVSSLNRTQYIEYTSHSGSTFAHVTYSHFHLMFTTYGIGLQTSLGMQIHQM